MSIATILLDLKVERERLNRAIAALEGNISLTRIQHHTSTKRAHNGGFHGVTPAGRKRLSQLMKQRWAERRRAGKNNLA